MDISKRLLKQSFQLVCWIAVFLIGGVQSVEAQQCPQLVWSDEFDGTTLDLTKWEPMIGDGTSYGLPSGWGNAELQYYKAENATVGNGVLQITALEERVQGKRYTSARLRTMNMGDFTYGRFEARIKMTETQGIWPAFWMLPTDNIYGIWPNSGEIDIMENVGNIPETVYGTIHYADGSGNALQSGTGYTLESGKYSDDFHVFAIEREPGVIRWFVDDVLYFTRTTADVLPNNWPFDERFHFLLNVAVGGNWPGSPDNSTVFPQVLEVDYVRVYDGNLPHISGDRLVPNQASGEQYTIGNPVGGSSFSWTVPAGATIVSGQGTATITVDWGSTGGDVVCDVTAGCGSSQFVLPVTVEPPYAYDFSFENFDDPGLVSLLSGTSGTLTEVANPNPGGSNTSAQSGRYVRNSGEIYDALFYDISVINDGSEYVSKQKKFYIDVYTAAPIGTEIILQLENSSLTTPINFPTGRHSRYNTFTTVQNQWERLELEYFDQPDAGTADNSIDNIVILFAPNSNTGDTYYFDNLDSYILDNSTPGENLASQDIPVSGSVTGNYTDTHFSDNTYQVIQEIQSGGSPNNRYSYLTHKWQINLSGGNPIIFNVEAYHTANSEGDAFDFAYSTDDVNYTNMLTVTKVSDDNTLQSFNLPGGLSGPVYIRVTDTDQTPGNRTEDQVFIDRMYIFADGSGTGGNPPNAPSNLSASTVSSSQIDLSWTDGANDEDGFRVERSNDGSNFSEIATTAANTTSYSDGGLSASTTYHYRVRAYNTNGNSAYSNTDNATTSGGGGNPVSMHVASITPGTENAGQGNKRGKVTVLIQDDQGNPVDAAQVDGTFTGDFNETVSGVTDASGSVDLVTSGMVKGSVVFNFCVDDVQHATLSYSPGDNVVTCNGLSKSVAGSEVLPDVFSLSQNYPNPFNPSTTITYTVAETRQVNLTIYDVLGKAVATLVNRYQQPGQYSIRFDARNLPSGVYLYRLTAGDFVENRKLLLMK